MSKEMKKTNKVGISTLNYRLMPLNWHNFQKCISVLDGQTIKVPNK